MMIDVEMLIIFGSSIRERPLDMDYRRDSVWFSHPYGTKDFENMVEAAELSVIFMILLGPNSRLVQQNAYEA